jgi:3-phosphoshikimate 1-carboxyvinyltransferase
MNIKIIRPALGGTIPAIASKSMAHRFLICAALAASETELVCSGTSNDIDATVRCLRALGADIAYSNGVFHVSPIPRPVIGAYTLDVGESGSTLRFMLPVVCALGADASFRMGGRLPSRPLSPLYEELVSHGCILSSQGTSPLTASGRLTSGTYTLAGNVSSQFISGLMFALPLLDGDSQIDIVGELESKPYVDMTADALRMFGISIRLDRRASYKISGNQRYIAPKSVAVEGDWSNAAFWLSLGAVTGQGITVTNLEPTSLQGDKSIADLLERFGACVVRSGTSVTVTRGRLRGVDIDAGNIPDLVPVIAAVASVSQGKTTIFNAGRLRIKESDRLETVTETLQSLGADIIETADGLVITGRQRLNGGTVDSRGDHRIAMAAAVAAAVCEGPVTINNADAVNKSYPGFFRDHAALGGRVKEVL